jgi:hypothetical protein
VLTRIVQWLVKDECLMPRHQRGIHPLPDDPPPATVEGLVREVHHLKCLTAQLWDQVWWMSLPTWKRVAYRYLGFRSPIQKFYRDP